MYYRKETYRNVPFEINYDLDPLNPFNHFDAMVPLIARTNYATVSYCDDEILDYLQTLTTTDGGKEFAKKFFKTEVTGTEKESNYLAEKLFDHLKTYPFSVIEEFFTALDIAHKVMNVNGDSQSEWYQLLLVATPTFFDTSGLTEESFDPKEFDYTADVFASWAFGNVFEFHIEFLNLTDSCCGFYGTDFANNGLYEYAHDMIDHYLDHVIPKRKAKKLKTLIKAKTPIELRPQILQQAIYSS